MVRQGYGPEPPKLEPFPKAGAGSGAADMFYSEPEPEPEPEYFPRSGISTGTIQKFTYGEDLEPKTEPDSVSPKLEP